MRWSRWGRQVICPLQVRKWICEDKVIAAKSPSSWKHAVLGPRTSLVMSGQASFLLPCSASFVKDESISFEDEERTPQSQTFLLPMVKPTWYTRKCRKVTFRHSDYLKGELQVQIEKPLSDLFRRFMLTALLKEGIRLVPTLHLSPLVSKSASYHYPENSCEMSACPFLCLNL